MLITSSGSVKKKEVGIALLEDGESSLATGGVYSICSLSTCLP
jgi:hypothetical protein